MTQKIRVGIIGLQPDVSWAARAHLPALKALSDKYEIRGVANTSLASAEAAAKACSIPIAFESVEAMAASTEIDLISVTVRVPYHLNLVRTVLAGGKAVYCEWPLGNGLAEAEEMAVLARKANVLAVVGTQARVAPAILHLRQLVENGYVGRVLSATVTAHGRSWGAKLPDFANRGYLLQKRNGATMLTIPLGHTLAAIRDVLGPFTEVSAIVTNRRAMTLRTDTEELVPFDAPDQVIIAGLIGDGVPISVHYRGGIPRTADGLIFEINGTEGDLRLIGRDGGSQQVPLRIEGARGREREMAAIPVPAELVGEGWPEDINPANVARIYARLAQDYTEGTHLAPTFDDAMELHRLIDTIEKASASKKCLPVNAPNRPLPVA